jgi:THO complex subunit 2
MQVCRVLRSYYSAALASASSPVSNASDGVENDRRRKEARLRVEEALGACLLPSLQLLPANPAVGLEIWDVMSLLPYEVIDLQLVVLLYNLLLSRF